MFNMIIEPLAAGVVGAGVAYMMEGDSRYVKFDSLAKYGAIVTACQFTGKRLTDMLLPEFKK